MSDSILTTEQQLRSLWNLGGLSHRELGRRLWGGMQETDLTNRAYELAYNFLLALFPLLFLLFALLGLFVQENSKLRQDLLTYLYLALPPSAYGLIVKTLGEITRNDAAGKVTFGLIFALVSGSAGMTQLMATLNAVYQVQETRSWIRVHLISLGLTFAMAVFVISALFLILAGGQMVIFAGQILDMSVAAAIAVKIVQWILALSFVAIAFAMVYYFAPDVEEQHWYWITPGSVGGLILWVAASGALRVYLHFFNSYTRTYGSLGAVMILMLWFYLTGLAFLIGGQINATIEHASAEQGHIEAKAPGQKAA
jgi:membrane protein